MLKKTEVIERFKGYFKEWEKKAEVLEIYIGSEFTGHDYRSIYLFSEEHFEKNGIIGGEFSGAGRGWYNVPRKSIVFVKDAKVQDEEIFGGKELVEGYLLWIGVNPRRIFVWEGKYDGKIPEYTDPEYFDADGISEDPQLLSVDDLKPVVKYAWWDEEKIDDIEKRIKQFIEGSSYPE